MADTLTRLRWQLQVLQQQLDEDIHYYRNLPRHRIKQYFSQLYYKILKKENEIAMFLEIANIVGRICIQNNLPGGDPCWISEKIMSNV
jgi:hypothetical protein